MFLKTLLIASAAAILTAQVDAQHSYKAPWTPWGDPDIQGNYTTLTEVGTPLEKPKEFEGRNLSDTRGFPSSAMPTIYGNSSQIVQGPGYVAITYEMIHDTRLVPIAPVNQLGHEIRSDMGYPRGHWEGDTLVVETTNFVGRSTFRNATPDRLKVVERFTPLSPTQLRWTVTIDDPTTWTRPWTFTLPLTLNPSEPMMPYECHEGNYGLKNILSAARAEERKAAEATKP